MADKKIGLIVTHAADDPELATLAFVLATGAMAMGVEPVICLQCEAVTMALPGGAEAVKAEGMPPSQSSWPACLQPVTATWCAHPASRNEGSGRASFSTDAT
jgi:predicted peroxiredoxin